MGKLFKSGEGTKPVCKRGSFSRVGKEQNLFVNREAFQGWGRNKTCLSMGKPFKGGEGTKPVCKWGSLSRVGKEQNLFVNGKPFKGGEGTKPVSAGTLAVDVQKRFHLLFLQL